MSPPPLFFAFSAFGRLTMKKTINIHAVLPLSAVNGPGKRLVVFFQGCRRGCAGCFNPDTHSFGERGLYQAGEVFERFLTSGVEGMTVSGGEPFEQPEGLIELLGEAAARGLSRVVYTGFTIEEIREDGVMAACLSLIDVLIDSPYEKGKKETTLLARGSSNQRIHLLTGRYQAEDFVMPGRVEILIGRDGVIRETGFGSVAPKAANG